jgi:hypothetical protein
MRIGSLAQSRTWWLAGCVAVAALTATPRGALGQAPPANHVESGSPYGHAPGMYPDPHGYPGHAPHGGFTGPMPMGDGGTCPPVGYDLMNDVGTEGYLVDQRGPHYFDVRAEAVFLDRDETFGPSYVITTEGFAQDPVRLTTDQLNYDPEPGFRIIGRYDICPLSVLEFGYMGIYTFQDAASFTDPNNPDLFSIFSFFGTIPADVTDVGGPMPQTERARTHSISIESDLQTAEISYRRYWVGWVPRISGTLLAGFRYTKLTEEFEFSSVGSEIPNGATELASLDYTVDADNDLAGFQTGADIWVGLMQGLRFGAEGKAGLYANHYKVTHTYDVTPAPDPTDPDTSPLFLEPEEFAEDEPAFIAEASVDLVADVLPSISLRVGYEVLFINSIVLAGDNFNPGSPYNPGPVDNGLGPLRTPFDADDGEAFYHGGHAGIEFIW